MSKNFRRGQIDPPPSRNRVNFFKISDIANYKTKMYSGIGLTMADQVSFCIL